VRRENENKMEKVTDKDFLEKQNPICIIEVNEKKIVQMVRLSDEDMSVIPVVEVKEFIRLLR